jgi:phosphate transport system permease protein
VLTLLTLPTHHHRLRAQRSRRVPPSIREAALGVGRLRLQTGRAPRVCRSAMPGMLDGRDHRHGPGAGESAPLLMIGMVAFIVDGAAEGMFDPATALPVQVSLV